MDFLIDFLVNNYFWFLLITIVLFFSLVGYIVDSKEQKTVTVFNSPLEMQRNLTNLAVSAQNKTIGEVVAPNNGSNLNYPQNLNASPMQNYPQSTYSNTQNYFNGQNQNFMNQNGNVMNNGYPQNQSISMGTNVVNPSSSFEVLGK